MTDVSGLCRLHISGIPGKSLYFDDLIRLQLNHPGGFKDYILTFDTHINISRESQRLLEIPWEWDSTGGFNCSYNRFDTLEHGPRKCYSDFDCSNNDLTSLKHGPSFVSGSYTASSNKLTSFEGVAKHINGDLILGNNDIESLVGIHKHIERCSSISLGLNRIDEGGLGLLFIDNLNSVHIGTGNTDASLALKIIKPYLKTGMKGLLECQQKLIDAGLERFAKL